MQAEIDAAFPPINYASFFAEPTPDRDSQIEQQEKPAPLWDRDAYESAWQDSVINAALEHERETRVGGLDREPESAVELSTFDSFAKAVPTPSYAMSLSGYMSACTPDRLVAGR